mgnify:CR=1 FL=1
MKINFNYNRMILIATQFFIIITLFDILIFFNEINLIWLLKNLLISISFSVTIFWSTKGYLSQKRKMLGKSIKDDTSILIGSYNFWHTAFLEISNSFIKIKKSSSILQIEYNQISSIKHFRFLEKYFGIYIFLIKTNYGKKHLISFSYNEYINNDIINLFNVKLNINPI